MSTYRKYRDTAIGTTSIRLRKRITHKRRKEIYAELCETRTDHKACWIEAGKLAQERRPQSQPVIKKQPPNPIRCWRDGKTLYAGQNKAAKKAEFVGTGGSMRRGFFYTPS